MVFFAGKQSKIARGIYIIPILLLEPKGETVREKLLEIIALTPVHIGETDSLTALSRVSENGFNSAGDVPSVGQAIAPDAVIVAEIRLDERVVEKSDPKAVGDSPQIAVDKAALAADSLSVGIAGVVFTDFLFPDRFKIQHKTGLIILSMSAEISSIALISPFSQQLTVCQPQRSAA